MERGKSSGRSDDNIESLRKRYSMCSIRVGSLSHVRFRARDGIKYSFTGTVHVAARIITIDISSINPLGDLFNFRP